MHRKLLVWALAGTLGITAAEPVVAQDVLIGVKGAVNAANIETNSSLLDDTSDRIGFLGGVFASIGLNDLSMIQPELLYSQRGYRQSARDVEIDYIEIPLLLKGSYNPPGSAFRPAAYLGGALSFEARCKVEVDPDSKSDCDEAGLERNTTDFGLLMGIGADVLVSPDFVFLVDVRYNVGLNDINDDPAVGDAVRSRTWSFMAGFGVPLNR